MHCQSCEWARARTCQVSTAEFKRVHVENLGQPPSHGSEQVSAMAIAHERHELGIDERDSTRSRERRFR